MAPITVWVGSDAAGKELKDFLLGYVEAFDLNVEGFGPIESYDDLTKTATKNLSTPAEGNKTTEQAKAIVVWASSALPGTEGSPRSLQLNDATVLVLCSMRADEAVPIVDKFLQL
eukprot:CAMPEP_0196659360 /NCGR_PEP_ID=MMETSP1086-20130531/34530_1 /TAXON_ID=77921 /ORGANISM="Cyanoptyche  gloeocystis , Strain SAG4.97" /LENGTH=114 /DNA_ID=CAMNT_0041993309 /DNA_START=23 /DNA_END=367 /DNA_ORIENTATION=+